MTRLLLALTVAVLAHTYPLPAVAGFVAVVYGWVRAVRKGHQAAGSHWGTWRAAGVVWGAVGVLVGVVVTGGVK